MQCRKFASKLRNGKGILSDFEPLLLDGGFEEVGQSFYHQITIKMFSRLSLLPPPIFPPFLFKGSISYKKSDNVLRTIKRMLLYQVSINKYTEYIVPYTIKLFYFFAFFLLFSFVLFVLFSLFCLFNSEHLGNLHKRLSAYIKYFHNRIAQA